MIKREFAGILALALTLFALLIQPAPAQQIDPIYCAAAATYDASTNGSTRIITSPADNARRTYICDISINIGATATNVQLKSGTGTNCGTNTANVTPNFVLPIAGQYQDMSGVWRGLVVPVNQDTCIVTSAGNPVQAIIYYTFLP